MKTTQRCFSLLAMVACMGVLLGAPAARATAPTQCQSNCASKTGGVLQACMEKCPEPNDSGSNAKQIQACAMRCSKSFEGEKKACAARCAKSGGNKKKGQPSTED